MSNLAKHIPIVKEHIAIQERLAKRYEKDARRSGMHVVSRDSFSSLLKDLIESDEALDTLQKPSTGIPGQAPALTLRPDELDGLPDELIAELSEGAMPDKTEVAITNVIVHRGGIATLDQIMISLYRATGEIFKRTTLTSKLYRMSQKNSIYQVPGRKGLYSVKRMTEDDVKGLFESEDSQASLI